MPAAYTVLDCDFYAAVLYCSHNYISDYSIVRESYSGTVTITFRHTVQRDQFAAYWSRRTTH